MSCPICAWSADNLKYRFLYETAFWRVVLAPNQALVGRCVVHLKRHAGDLADLTPEELLDWLVVVRDLEAALRAALGATMFNWSCYMNHSYREAVPEPHIHWWAVPRYDRPVAIGEWTFTDPDFGSPYDHGRWQEVPPEIQGQIAERIRRFTLTDKSDVERAIVGEVVVPASVAEVWQAWTTEEGAQSFFAPRCRIEPRPGGAYEILFDPDAEPGSRGAEGMMVMAAQPPRMLAFTWNAPPSLPTVRDQMTHVIIRLSEMEAGGTRVSLRHDGWGTGGEWDQAFQYFTRAWNDVVLPRLRWRFEHGPVDWDNPPALGTAA